MVTAQSTGVFGESLINAHNADGAIVPIDRVADAIPVTSDQRPVFVAVKAHVGFIGLCTVGTFLDVPKHCSMPR